jgi:hypothetical protein
LPTQGSPPLEANTSPMPDPRAQRTLVKSPPEIWAEVSDVSTLARHLGEFGEIRITQLEAETTVVWEGDRARGMVELEASGWGTKVTITAEAIAAEEAEIAEAEAEVEADVVDAEPEPEVVAEEVVEKEAAPIEAEVIEEIIETPEPRRSLFARLRRRRRAAEPAVEPIAIEPIVIEPEIVPPVEAPEPVAEIAEIADAVEVPEAPAISEPDLAGEITAAAATAAFDPEQVEAVLVGVLDDLGSAHHRPFSRG